MAATKVEVKVEDGIAAPASAVWELIRGFGDIARWAGTIESCEVEGEGVGAVRSIRAGGLALQERLEAYDEPARTFSYSIIGDAPLPLREYLSTVKITEDGADRARIEWSSTFEPHGAPEEQCRQLVEGIYRGGIAGMKKSLGV